MRNRWLNWLVLLVCFTVPVSVTRVVDGYTFDITAPSWLNVTVNERVRVLEVDTPELKELNGIAAKDFTTKWLAEKKGVTATTCKRDSFGRILGVVKDVTGATLAQDLKDA